LRRKIYRGLVVGVMCCLLTVSMGYAQESTRTVWAFYLSFWAGVQTWDWHDAVLTDYPLMGLYNSKLPEVAAMHIEEAKSGGINAFWVNWWGLDENVTTTPALLNMMGRAAEQNFKIAVVVDLYVPEFNRDLVRLEDSLRWVVDTLTQQPAYLHYHGKPLIAFAFPSAANFSTAEWQALRNAVDPLHETWWVSEGLSACCLYGGAMDGMYAFNMAWASGSTDYYLAERNIVYENGASIYFPSVSPGWDEDLIARETNRPNPTSPRPRADGQFLLNAWNAAMNTGSDAVIVVSWNEFPENSHIEPSQLYSTQSLFILRQLSEGWTGILAPPFAPLPNAYAARTPEVAEVHATSQRDSAIIGQTTAGAAYQILGEDSGLYLLQIDGVLQGYVPFESIEIVWAN
jgi:hypothetical protein